MIKGCDNMAEVYFYTKQDEIEIIWCKDCKFYHTEECPMDDWHFAETKEDDFCSYAERKEQ